MENMENMENALRRAIVKYGTDGREYRVRFYTGGNDRPAFAIYVCDKHGREIAQIYGALAD